MILMIDEVRVWGHIATTHYTHPPRSVVMQFSLAGRVDFTETPPNDPVFRAVAFFMGTSWPHRYLVPHSSAPTS